MIGDNIGSAGEIFWKPFSAFTFFHTWCTGVDIAAWAMNHAAHYGFVNPRVKVGILNLRRNECINALGRVERIVSLHS